MRDCVILINDTLVSLSHTTHSSSLNLPSLVHPSVSESWSEGSGLWLRVSALTLRFTLFNIIKKLMLITTVHTNVLFRNRPSHSSKTPNVDHLYNNTFYDFRLFCDPKTVTFVFRFSLVTFKRKCYRCMCTVTCFTNWHPLTTRPTSMDPILVKGLPVSHLTTNR
jgi:hypothetical protein